MHLDPLCILLVHPSRPPLRGAPSVQTPIPSCILFSSCGPLCECVRATRAILFTALTYCKSVLGVRTYHMRSTTVPIPCDTFLQMERFACDQQYDYYPGPPPFHCIELWLLHAVVECMEGDVTPSKSYHSDAPIHQVGTNCTPTSLSPSTSPTWALAGCARYPQLPQLIDSPWFCTVLPSGASLVSPGPSESPRAVHVP